MMSLSEEFKGKGVRLPRRCYGSNGVGWFCELPPGHDGEHSFLRKLSRKYGDDLAAEPALERGAAVTPAVEDLLAGALAEDWLRLADRLIALNDDYEINTLGVREPLIDEAARVIRRAANRSE